METIKITLLKVPEWLKKSQLYRNFIDNISYEIGSLKWLGEMNKEIEIEHFKETDIIKDEKDFEQLIRTVSYWDYEDDDGNKYPISVYVYCYAHENESVKLLDELSQTICSVKDLIKNIEYNSSFYFIHSNRMLNYINKNSYILDKFLYDKLSFAYSFHIFDDRLYILHEGNPIFFIEFKYFDPLKIVNFLEFLKDDETFIDDNVQSSILKENIKLSDDNKMISYFIKTFSYDIVLSYDKEKFFFFIYDFNLKVVIPSFKKEYFYFLTDTIRDYLKNKA